MIQGIKRILKRLYEPINNEGGWVAVALVAMAATTYMSMRQQSKTAQYNADAMEGQAKVAKQKAVFEEDLHRDRVRKVLSSQQAAYGARGIDTSEGTALLTMQDTAGEGELDALAIRYGGDVEEANARSMSNLYKMQSKNLKTMGYIKTGTTLLQGAASAYGGGAASAGGS